MDALSGAQEAEEGEEGEEVKRALLMLISFLAGAGSWAGWTAFHASRGIVVDPSDVQSMNLPKGYKLDPPTTLPTNFFDQIDAEEKSKLPLQKQIDDLRNRVAVLEKK